MKRRLISLLQTLLDALQKPQPLTIPAPTPENAVAGIAKRGGEPYRGGWDKQIAAFPLNATNPFRPGTYAHDVWAQDHNAEAVMRWMIIGYDDCHWWNKQEVDAQLVGSCSPEPVPSVPHPECPYDRHSDERRAWIIGWNTACLDLGLDEETR